MDTLELDAQQVRILKEKAYEWRGKINKRHNRGDYFKTNHAIRRFKRYLKGEQEQGFIPNKTEILLTITWFMRCPSQNDDERLVCTFVGLIYKLHRGKLSNINP